MGLLTPAALAHRLPIRSGAVQLCFTSPPYYQQRSYGAKGSECPTGAAWLDWPAVLYCPMPGLTEIEVEPWRGQLGHEPAVEMYVGHLVYCFREVRRTLHRSGVLWVNLGDKMSSDDKWGGACGGKHVSDLHGENETRERMMTGLGQGNLLQVPARFALAMQADGWILRSGVFWEANRLPESVAGCRWERCRVKVESVRIEHPSGDPSMYRVTTGGDKLSNTPATIWEPCPGCPKCEGQPLDCPLCVEKDLAATFALIAQILDDRDADEMCQRAAAWLGATPCPICDGDRFMGGLVLRRGSWRPTNVVEHVFMFTKTADYWASGEAVREPHARLWGPNNGGTMGRQNFEAAIEGRVSSGENHRGAYPLPNPAGRNIRNVWRINTEPSSERHYAGFPTGLVRPALLSSTPEAGVCRGCGEPWSEVVTTTGYDKQRWAPGEDQYHTQAKGRHGATSSITTGMVQQKTVIGWLPSCTCLAVSDPLTVAEARKLTRPALVLDCFGGTGTTAKVARFHGRRAVTVDPILAYSLIARDKAGEACVEVRAARPKRFSVSGPLFDTSGR